MSTDLKTSIGLDAAATEARIAQYINLKLALLGLPTVALEGASAFDDMAAALLSHHQETDRLLADYLCPADRRIQEFLNAYLHDAGPVAKLPVRTFVLERHGLARALSLPPNQDSFLSSEVSSYRVKQGVL